MTTARTVSWMASCPRNARAYHSASSIAATASGGMASGRFCSSSAAVVGGFWKKGIAGRPRSMPSNAVRDGESLVSPPRFSASS